MDNFKRYRPSRDNPKSTDGFMPRKSKSAKLSLRSSRLKSGVAYPESSGLRRRIDDFSGPEGFRPINRNLNRGLGNTVDNPRNERRPARHGDGSIKIGHKQKLADKNASKKPSSKTGRFRRKLKELYFFNPFSRKNWTKQRALASGLTLVVLSGLVFGGFAWWNLRNILQGGGGAVALQENVDPSLLRGEGDGRVNILLLGHGGAGHDGAELTDTIVIASINPIQKEAALLSIPRDLYVQNSAGNYNKINEVFINAKNLSLSTSGLRGSSRTKAAEDAGFKAIEQMISNKIGIPIHYRVMVDFTGFQKAINTVGGIDIDVTEELAVYEWFGPSFVLDVKPGRQHFNGERALGFARSRKGVNAGGDHGRANRQRAVITAFKDKVLSAGTYSNPWKISQLMSDFGKHVRTNISVDEALRLREIGNEIPSNKIASVDLVTAPNDHIVGTMINGLSVQIPKAGIDDYSDVKHFVRNRLKDGFLAQENATVAIYNGTMITGLANLTSKDLKSYGYNISAVKDAPTKGVQKTIVVDLRKGQKKYTKRYLENRFGTTAVSSIPDAKINPGEADFVIILGQNEQTRLAN